MALYDNLGPGDVLQFKPASAHVGLFILRLVLAAAFLDAGLDKLINGFSAFDYLQNATGPFAGFFSGMAGGINVINPIVIGGEIMIGLGLAFGFLLRLVSLGGVVMMALYYLPYIPPPEGWVSDLLVYAFIFIALMLSGSGYFFGLDRYFINLEQTRNPLRLLFG